MFIVTRKSNLYLAMGVAVAALIGTSFLLQNRLRTNKVEQTSGPQGLEAKFVQLASAKTNFCAGPQILDQTEADRLQGSCCSAMDFHRYTEQVEGLRKYSLIDKIPTDPYDIPVTLARVLLDFQQTIQLTTQQQAVYDEAVKISPEGGPCCCKCWRWYAFEGLAKYLITEHDFSAQQAAEIWELEDGCGGAGHVDDVHGVS